MRDGFVEDEGVEDDAGFYAAPLREEPSLDELVRTFASIGLFSFGGAAGQIAMMFRIVVEEKRWLDEQRFMHALNYCMLLPGPEAQQLATYIGWLKHGVVGGLVTGLLFILPGALVMLGLSALYVYAADVAIIEGVFFGIKAAVLAIIVQSVFKIGARGLRTPLLIGLAVVAFLGLFFFKLPFPLLILACGLAGGVAGYLAPLLVGLYPAETLPAEPQPAGRWQDTARVAIMGLAIWWAPVLFAWLVLGGNSIVVELGLFFSKLAVLTFGGAYALLAWLAQEAVSQGWVDALEMADGLGLAETTPGPTILVTQFVGFLAAFRDSSGLPPLAAATLGAMMVTWVTFAPSFLWIFAGAPFIEDLRGNQKITGALRAISAAVVGVVANLGLWFALHVLFRDVSTIEGPFWKVATPDISSLDGAAALLCLIAFGLVFLARLGLVPVIAIMAALGIVARFLG